MRPLLTALTILAVPVTLAAQQNPFKQPKPSIGKFKVTAELSGDMKGTVTAAMDGDRMVRRASDSVKMMGRTTKTESWSLTTRDSVYSADLIKKTGTVAPNLLPALATAYDQLGADGKQRFAQNMADMSAMMSQAFNISQINSGEKLGKKSYAGQECEERKFGGFLICQMDKAPIVLHSAGNLVCFNFEEKATSVKLGSASSELFAPPAGVTFKQVAADKGADSSAKAMVAYLASKALSDSIAKAKVELEAAKAKAAREAKPGQPEKMTPEQQAQMQDACNMVKNFDMDKVLADAGKAWKQAMLDGVNEFGNEVKNDVKNEVKNQTINKLRGLFKRP